MSKGESECCDGPWSNFAAVLFHSALPSPAATPARQWRERKKDKLRRWRQQTLTTGNGQSELTGSTQRVLKPYPDNYSSPE